MKTVQLTMDEAVGLVKEGSEIIFAEGDPQPMAFLREVITRGAKDLKMVTKGGGLNVDILVGAGATTNVDTCGMSFGSFGRDAPNFVRYLKAGRIKAKDST